jgi:uridine kinase
MIYVKEIIESPRVGAYTLITIDGRAGSGKSTLARYLADVYHATVFQSDDFSGWENALDWQSNFIAVVLTPLAENRLPITYQPVSWWDGHHPELKVVEQVNQIIILEGTGANHSLLENISSLRLFVDTPTHLCLERGIERDVAAGIPIDEVRARWNEWQHKEDEYFLNNPVVGSITTLDGQKDFQLQIT